MANSILVFSSYIAVVLHLWVNFIIAYDTWWIWKRSMILVTLSRVLCQLGTFTSVWNHSVTTERAKTTDRLVIRTAAFLNVLSIPSIQRVELQFLALSMLLISLASYILAKIADNQMNSTQNPIKMQRFRLNRDILHITVHASGTIADIIIASFSGRKIN